MMFVVGRTYFGRSVCDHDTVIKLKVLRRTEKTITAETARGEQTFRVSEYQGVEQVKPWGSYSMAPIIGADRVEPLGDVPTTCIEHAYGTAVRLSFQIKVF